MPSAPHLFLGHLRRHAEIGFEHARIGVDLGGGALGQLAALLEHDHLVAEGGDELDIVLDDQEGLAGAVELLQRDLDLADAARIDAGDRLVEHDDPGMRHQRGGERHQLLLAVGQDAGLDLVVFAQADQLDQLARALLRRLDRVAIAAGAEELVDPGGRIELLRGDREIVAQR